MSAIAAPQKSPGKEVDLGPLKKGDVILTSENDGVWDAMLAAEDQISAGAARRVARYRRKTTLSLSALPGYA